MNRHLITLLAIVILTGAFTVSANAQTAGAQKVVANVPFAFNVGNTNLPAGKYTITVINPSSDRKILQIRNVNGRASAIVSTNAIAGIVSDDARLTFKRYGDRYFFAEAQMAGDLTSFAALKSHAERAQKMLVAAGNQSVIVVVAE